ncbi:MAG: glycosyltransferase family 4 protein [Candidatus Binataceae bacterium]
METRVPARRVAMLLHGYYAGDGRVRREAEALASAGYQVDVVCLRRPPRPGEAPEPRREVMPGGVRVYRLPLSRKRASQLRYFFEYGALTVMGAWKLLVLHCKNRYDAVHIHNMPDILVLAGIIPKWSGASLVLDVHDPMVELYRSTHTKKSELVPKILRWQEGFSYGLADKVVSVSDTMRENLQDKGVPPGKIFILHNFPDDRYFPRIREGELTPWPRQPDELKLLYSGTVTDHYRVDIAVRAVALAAKTIPGLKLQILGGGNRLEDIRGLVKRLGLEDRVDFLGTVRIEQVREVMRRADVGISTHHAGVFGELYFATKVIEFLTQGLPVICSRTRTIERYFPDDAIFYFRPDDPEDMARQILLLWQQPSLVRKKIASAQKVLPRYTWEAERNRFIDFYGGLGDHRQTRAAS